MCASASGVNVNISGWLSGCVQSQWGFLCLLMGNKGSTNVKSEMKWWAPKNHFYYMCAFYFQLLVVTVDDSRWENIPTHAEVG